MSRDPEYLAAVLSRQVADRECAGTTMRTRAAHFPAVKTLEDFDQTHLPSLRTDVLAHLATAGFVPRADNVVLLGPPGIGKTHLAIGLGIKAAPAGHSVLFYTASGWVSRLGAARRTGQLDAELKKIRRYRLIVVDEAGYIPFDTDAANLSSSSSQPATSNRLVHHAEVLTLTGDTYRTRTHRDLVAEASPQRPKSRFEVTRTAHQPPELKTRCSTFSRRNLLKIRAPLTTLTAGGVNLLRPARKGEPGRAGSRFLKPLRQIVESASNTLKTHLDLERHAGRTPRGVIARICQRLLALNTAIWHNDTIDPTPPPQADLQPHASTQASPTFPLWRGV